MTASRLRRTEGGSNSDNDAAGIETGHLDMTRKRKSFRAYKEEEVL
jgi:hypothetical protein